MLSRRTEFFLSSRVGRAVRWLLPTALLALTPKCLLCIAAYAGLGAALGFGGPEMCGAPNTTPMSWVSLVALFGIDLGVVGILVGRRARCAARSPADRLAH